MTLITRAEWGARPPTRTTALSTPVREIWIHHGAGSSANPIEQWRGYQAFHMGTRGWSDIAYNFGIGRGGEVLEGRGAGRVGGGTGSPQDQRSYSVCFIGNFETEQPTQAALDACADLLAQLIEDQLLTRDFAIYGDRDKNSTACPGRHLYSRLQGIRTAALAIVDNEGDDMPTPEKLESVRVGFNRRRPEDVMIVQDYLRAAGFKPGRSDGVIGTMTERALTNFGIQGDATRLGVQGFARLVFAAVGGKMTEPPIIEVPVPGPPADCAAVEAELAKARGELASALTKIRAAKDALV